MKRSILTLAIVALILTAPIVAANSHIWQKTGESHDLSADVGSVGGVWFDTPNETIYVVDFANRDLVEYDSDFNFVQRHTTSSSARYQIARGENGNYFIGTGAGGSVEEYDTDFNLVDTHNPGGSVGGVYQNATGQWYIANFDQDQIEVWSQDFSTQLKTYSVPEVVNPTRVVVEESSNNMSVLDSTNDDVEYYAYENNNYTHDATYDLNESEVDAIALGARNESSGNLFWAANVSEVLFAYTGPTNGAPTVETTLELEIDRWMPFNEDQAYTVTLNETNTTTGDTNLTDVTDDANVTVYNITNTTGFSEPIVSVNNTTDTLHSHNHTGVVAVNATWNGNTLDNATNVTVGNRNLTNIGLMPPEQWIPSFLGLDESPTGEDSPHGIGSSMQWTLFIIVVMSAATRMFENPWAGVGSGMLTSILIWVLGYIALGLVLVTVFSGILLGLIMSRSDMGRGVTRDNEYSGVLANRRP